MSTAAADAANASKLCSSPLAAASSSAPPSPAVCARLSSGAGKKDSYGGRGRKGSRAVSQPACGLQFTASMPIHRVQELLEGARCAASSIAQLVRTSAHLLASVAWPPTGPVLTLANHWLHCKRLSQ